MNKLTIVALGAALLGLSAVAAEPVAWFNGGVSADWPNAASMSGGEWSNTEGQAEFADGALEVFAEEETPLSFTATTAHTVGAYPADEELLFESEIAFEPYGTLPESIAAVAKVAVCVKGGTYYVLANEDGGANAWTNTEIAAACEGPVAVRISVGPAGVKYTIGGTDFTCTANLGDKTFSKVGFAGSGAVKALTGAVRESSAWTGAGTEADPYVIGDKAGLDELVRKSAANDFAGTFFRLGADLDLADAGAFAGIGAFAGTFDGNGRTISNVTMTDRTYAGIFNEVSGTVRNLVVSNIYFTGASGSYGAAIVGKADPGALLQGLTMDGTVGTAEKPGNHNTAGVLVNALGTSGDVTVESCTNAASVYCTYTKPAGVVGFTTRDGSVKTNEHAVIIRDCVNTGTIHGYYNNASGITQGIGEILGMSLGRAVIDGCTAAGDVAVAEGVSMTNWVGSLIGSVVQTVEITGETKASAGRKAVGGYEPGYNQLTTGYMFATVEGGVATFCDAVPGGSFKVMVKGAAVELELGESITLDETFYEATVTAATPDAVIVKNGNTYTAEPAGPTPDPDRKDCEIETESEGVYVVTPVGESGVVTITGSKPEYVLKIASPADLSVRGANGATVKVMVNGCDVAPVCVGGIEAFATALSEEKVRAVIDDRTGIETPFAAGETSEVTINPVPGLTYTLKVATAVDGLYGKAAGDNAEKTAATADPITLTDAEPPEGAGFYKISVRK